LFNIQEILEDLVTSKILSNVYKTASDESFEEWLSLASSEQDKIKKKLFELVLNFSCENQICRFFNHYQTKLITLSNLLYDHIEPEYRFYSLPEVRAEMVHYRAISFLNIVEDLLTHSDIHYSKFINQETLIPKKLRDIAVKQFDCILTDFKLFNQFLPEKLIQIISAPLEKFISNPELASIRNLNYLTKFTSELTRIPESEKQSMLVLFIDELFYLNYNSISFFNYVTDEICEAISGIDTISGKIEKLSWYLKETNQKPLKPGMVFNPGQKSIHD
jgi:hypothetical protein